MEIRGLKVLKSKGLVFAQFCSKYDNSSSDWWKTVQILEEKYSRHIFVKNVNGIWNIQIFFTFFHNLKIFDVRFEASVQLVPTILFTSFLQPASIETDPIANHPSAVDHIQLVPKYISKVKLERGWSPNILSEIIGLHENEGRGGILAKISNWQLYIGRAA